jgi:SAM-dependent methyltransferase
MQIYDDYDDEPEDIFLPLDDARYSDFYELEMGNFLEDLPFYQQNLPAIGSILEVACGTGRLCNLLAHPGRTVTGLDNSLPMLQKARRKSNICRYVAMDMRRLAFSRSFDAIIIPYNSLNLLAGERDVESCLAGCRQLLRSGGLLLLQLFVPNMHLLQQAGQKSFQFQIFDDPALGRVVKEVRKTFDRTSGFLQLEERYRVRPLREDQNGEDFSRTMNLCLWPAEKWFDLLRQSGFSIERLFGGFDMKPFLPGLDSCLLLTASRK